MPIDQSKKDTIHLIVKSKYIVQILKNTNPKDLTVHHFVESDSVTVYNMRPENYDDRHVISSVLSTNTHHDKFDQVVYENSYVRLIIEYQMIM